MYVQNQASTVPLGYLRVGYKLELYELRKYSGFDTGRKGRVGTDALIEAHQLELHEVTRGTSSPLFFVFLVSQDLLDRDLQYCSPQHFRVIRTQGVATPP